MKRFTVPVAVFIFFLSLITLKARSTQAPEKRISGIIFYPALVGILFLGVGFPLYVRKNEKRWLQKRIEENTANSQQIAESVWGFAGRDIKKEYTLCKFKKVSGTGSLQYLELPVFREHPDYSEFMNIRIGQIILFWSRPPFGANKVENLCWYLNIKEII